jgi:hypothetical protein
MYKLRVVLCEREISLEGTKTEGENLVLRKVFIYKREHVKSWCINQKDKSSNTQ